MQAIAEGLQQGLALLLSPPRVPVVKAARWVSGKVQSGARHNRLEAGGEGKKECVREVKVRSSRE
jgi:hypothetical protein